MGTLVLFWYSQIRKYYSPISDEFSLFVNSAKLFRPVFSEWFLHGFSRYFVPYPEWTIESTNFIRPVVNAEYYVSSLVFGTHWAWYLLSNYFIQSLLVVSVVYFSLRHLRVSLFTAAGIGILCFVSPAFDNGALYSTSFAFDLLAALLVILGLNQLLSGNFILAWTFFAVALFTKETAFFSPLAAAVVIYLRSTHRGPRRLIVPTCFVLPYVVWGMLRWIAFHGASGVYALPAYSLGPYVKRVLKEFLRWPIPFDVPYRTNSGPHSVSISPYVFAFMNLCFWIALLYLAFRFLRSRMRHGGVLTQAGDSGANGGFLASPMIQAMLIFCTGSIAILLLIPNLQPRFGATFLPLFALMLVAFLQARNSELELTLTCLMLIVPPIIKCTERTLHFSADLMRMRSQWAMAADYVSKISRATSATIYVVNDVSGGYSSTDSIRRFAGYQGTLVRVNDLISIENCTPRPKMNIQRVSIDHIKVTAELDSLCAGYAFLSSGMSYPIDGEEITRTIAHTRIIYHGVPAAAIRFLSASGRLSVDITGAAGSWVLLVPDLESGVYREVAFNR